MANFAGVRGSNAGQKGDLSQQNTPSSAAANIGSGSIFFRSKLRSAISSSNDLISSISNRLSLLSNPPDAPPRLPPTPPEQAQSLATREWVEGAWANRGEMDPPSSPETTITKLKGKFKLENLQENLQELGPALEDLIAPDPVSDQSSTLPSNTPPYSPGIGERIRAAINPTLERKLEDYKATACQKIDLDVAGAGAKRLSQTNCSIKVDLVEDSCSPRGSQGDPQDSNREGEGLEFSNAISNSNNYLYYITSKYYSRCHQLECWEFGKTRVAAAYDGTFQGATEGQSVSVSSRSFNSLHSLHATGPDPYDKLKYKHRSLTSLQSWASSLSYDSQQDDPNNPRDFMRSFVECIFKAPDDISAVQKAAFADVAKTDSGRLWFARCINGKRCCRCVCDASFLALVQHFSVVLAECAEADDFSPAKSLMNMCFTYYHEQKSPNSEVRTKEFLYMHLRHQPIWSSLRFWNAAFFDALQCERTLRPVATRQELEAGSKDQAVKDELHYQENITFGQLGTFTCNMHAFGLSKEMVSEFLRKQVTIASLRSEQVQLLRDNVNRLYSEEPEWQ
ncbi:hypothetical protein HAZT_HAZT005010 [Hyalella azteca]|uniref:SBF1/SBF2 domain-containing protein n=1 Tax=Hyalella azteca TaxID=294128 RepID=A0A6A0H641_HYAAZ|nr:hypothetical protein HAZT_HAZT005010 [Hyalella azteca]